MSLNRLIPILILTLVAGFLGIHLYGLIAPPALEIVSPTENLTTSSRFVAIKGRTNPGAKVEVNGNPIFSDRDGEFGHTLVLSGGINTIIVTAKKRYGRPATVVRQILILDGPRISTSTHGGI